MTSTGLYCLRSLLPSALAAPAALLMLVLRQVRGEGHPFDLFDCDEDPRFASLYALYAESGHRYTDELGVLARHLSGHIDFQSSFIRRLRQGMVHMVSIMDWEDLDSDMSTDLAEGWKAYKKYATNSMYLALCGFDNQYDGFCSFPPHAGVEQEEGWCPYEYGPYTFIMCSFFMILAEKRALSEQARDNDGVLDNQRLHSLIVYIQETMILMAGLLKLPYHTFEFLESSRWNISFFTIVANVFTEGVDTFDRFEDYAARFEVPPAVLASWATDWQAPPGWEHAGGAAHLRAVAGLLAPFRGASAASPICINACETVLPGPLRVVILEEHDATAWDDWQSLRVSLVSLGADPAAIQPRFLFTTVKGLKGCEDGEQMRTLTDVAGLTYKELRSRLAAAKEGQLNLLDLEEWLRQRWRADPSLRDAEVVLCGEPPFLCPLLASIRAPQGATLWHFNMGLLLWFYFSEPGDLSKFWADFYAALPLMVASSSTRYTAEQVLEQTGVRFPYVPWTALWAGDGSAAQTASRREEDFLLFHASTQPHYTFRLALRRFLEQPVNQDLRFYDMNSEQRTTAPEEDDVPGFFGLCRTQMAAFRAVVLLPHNPAPTRLIDLYAQLVPIFVPGEPSVHKYIWDNGAFGGLGSPEVMRTEAPAEDRPKEYQKQDAAHPPFSPFHFLRVQRYEFTFDELEAKRYWYQYTEFALMPGLQAFSSMADLLFRLRRSRGEAPGIISTMLAHLAERRAAALGWWRSALAVQLSTSAMAMSSHTS